MAAKLWNKLWLSEGEKKKRKTNDRVGDKKLRIYVRGPTSEGWGASGEAERLLGLPFSNIIKTYLFCVPHCFVVT